MPDITEQMKWREQYCYSNEVTDKVGCIKQKLVDINDLHKNNLEDTGIEIAKTISKMNVEQQEDEMSDMLDAPFQILRNREDAVLVAKTLVETLPANMKKQLFDEGILP
jgi:hypothetical protein